MFILTNITKQHIHENTPMACWHNATIWAKNATFCEFCGVYSEAVFAYVYITMQKVPDPGLVWEGVSISSKLQKFTSQKLN